MQRLYMEFFLMRKFINDSKLSCPPLLRNSIAIQASFSPSFSCNNEHRFRCGIPARTRRNENNFTRTYVPRHSGTPRRTHNVENIIGPRGLVFSLLVLTSRTAVYIFIAAYIRDRLTRLHKLDELRTIG